MHPHVSSQACQRERIAKAQREVSVDTQEMELQSQATGIENNQSQWTRFGGLASDRREETWNCVLTQVSN